MDKPPGACGFEGRVGGGIRDSYPILEAIA